MCGRRMSLGAENLVWQVNRRNGTEHPTGQTDPLTSLFPSGKKKPCFSNIRAP